MCVRKETVMATLPNSFKKDLSCGEVFLIVQKYILSSL